MNILYVNNKKAQESRCWTEKLGVNQCMIAAKNAVLDKFGVKIEESTVEQILRFGTADISAPYLDCISSIARQYVAELFSTLRKYEYNPDLMRLYVVGGGHVGASVVRLAKLLGLPVCALEDRPEFAGQLRQAGADPVLCLPFEEGLAAVSGGAECYFVVVTRAHSCDVQCLTAILQKPAAYVGMMGSRGRAALVRRQLTEAGLDPARVEQLHAPIGLAIGAKTAEEIALSILAQIVQVKSTRSLTEGFPPAILEAFRALQTPAVLATIVSRHGSTPREVGSKMLVLPEGRAVGSVGGGIMEYRIQQLAGKMLAGAAAPAQLADLTTDGTGDDAAIAACGGSMQVFLQRIEPEE